MNRPDSQHQVTRSRMKPCKPRIQCMWISLTSQSTGTDQSKCCSTNRPVMVVLIMHECRCWVHPNNIKQFEVTTKMTASGRKEKKMFKNKNTYDISTANVNASTCEATLFGLNGSLIDVYGTTLTSNMRTCTPNTNCNIYRQKRHKHGCQRNRQAWNRYLETLLQDVQQNVLRVAYDQQLRW